MSQTDHAHRLREMAYYESSKAEEWHRQSTMMMPTCGYSNAACSRARQVSEQSAAALLAGAAALEAMTPKPITEEHRDGNWWLVWEPFCYRWVTASWRERSEMWVRSDDGYVVAPTHVLPVPEPPKENNGEQR